MQLFLVTQPIRMSALEVTLTSLHSERTNKLYKEADTNITRANAIRQCVRLVGSMHYVMPKNKQSSN